MTWLYYYNISNLIRKAHVEDCWQRQDCMRGPESTSNDHREGLNNPETLRSTLITVAKLCSLQECNLVNQMTLGLGITKRTQSRIQEM